MSKYNTIYLPPKKLKENPGNPRFIRDDAFARLVKSLEECPELLEARPILCSNRTGELIVIDGNMHLRAARELKYKTVPVIIKQTQSNAGGMTELYVDSGTYIKSFFSVMYSPSCVKIATINSTHSRIHHQVNWNATAPKILSETHRKTD